MKLLLPSRSKGTHKFTAQNAPTLLSSTSQSSVSSPSLATHQTTSQSASGAGSSSEGCNTTINLNTIGTIALPAATIAANYQPGPNEPTALYPSSEVGSNKPTVPPLDQPNYPGTLYTFPSSPSASQPPSIPSSYVGSTISSLKPSSSISNKRKANDDDVSMTSESATRGSVVSVASGASSSSRKRRANRPASQDVSGLRDDLNALQSTFQVNFQANTDLMARIQSRPSNQPP
ncbi:hypothetical protein V8E55_001324, partial [Tylopilus felleus]